MALPALLDPTAALLMPVFDVVGTAVDAALVSETIMRSSSSVSSVRLMLRARVGLIQIEASDHMLVQVLESMK